MKKILFVCVHNAGRSQMAEAFFNHYAKGKAQAFSAGTHYASRIDPTVVEAMAERGIDISNKRPKMLTLEMQVDTDKIITMGCGEKCIYPGTSFPTEDWQLEDPEGKPIEQVRAIRDKIETKVKTLLEEIMA
ncbi:MAG: arsenate reductase ArsC [Chloroflexi bacterium]|jgi:protein-tyrosine-phosphatase|nr:arsenate reductase ArsC [Chloroflexota bacterium]